MTLQFVFWLFSVFAVKILFFRLNPFLFFDERLFLGCESCDSSR